MSARGRFATAAAVLAVSLTVAAVYVLLFTTAPASVAVWLGLAAAWSAAGAAAPLLGGGQVRGPEEPLELEPLRHPERYARKPPSDPVSLWLYEDEARRMGRGDMR